MLEEALNQKVLFLPIKSGLFLIFSLNSTAAILLMVLEASFIALYPFASGNFLRNDFLISLL